MAEPQGDLKRDELFGRFFKHYDGFLEFILWLHSFGILLREVIGKFGSTGYYSWRSSKKKKGKKKNSPVTAILVFFYLFLLLTYRGVFFAWAYRIYFLGCSRSCSQVLDLFKIVLSASDRTPVIPNKI